jgi:glycosyltransferase involved in cell wall biosynthesis
VSLSEEPLQVHCIIPAYRASATIEEVVTRSLEFADQVIVVDDGCPEHSGNLVQVAFAGNSRVDVVLRQRNGGVGAAMKSGIERALQSGADVIVKIDADGQMDAAYIPILRDLFDEDRALVCVKGNRFFDSQVLATMPLVRLIGNGILSLLAKIASGYWNVIDPTNGYLAFNARILKVLPWRCFADSYFFELSVLCELGLKRLPVLELEMPTIYTEAPSSLSIRKVAVEFPPKLLRYSFKRLLLQYLVFDVNLATVYFFFGFFLTLFGLVFGSYEWADGVARHVSKPIGTVMLAVLPFLMGFQLLLNALMYDVQFAQKTSHEILVNSHRRVLSRTSRAHH